MDVDEQIVQLIRMYPHKLKDGCRVLVSKGDKFAFKQVTRLHISMARHRGYLPAKHNLNWQIEGF